jgi:nitrogen-specific signal transduction histidine kinase/CheY-like chemotaxis protein
MTACHQSHKTEPRPQPEEPWRQSQKTEAIGQLAEGVAYDFNSFLTVIQGHSALLLADESLKPETRNALTEIYTAGARAASLIRQLLVFSGKQELRCQALDLNEFVSDAVKMLRCLLGETVALHLDLATQLPPVSADAGMLEQVLVNLAANAREAMPLGGQLHIQTARVVMDGEQTRKNSAARPGDFACLSVRDTGCGIAPEIRPRIFEPFFTTKPPGKGTGLGLATVFGIVKQHEGWVEVESQVGHGTTFKVFLPALPLTVEARRQPTATKPLRGTETILVVEDEAAMRGLVVLILQRYGYRVLEAVSGEEALLVWGRHQSRIELLFTDLVLPGDLPGWKLAEKLRSEKPGLKVIFTSSYGPDMMGPIFATMEKINFLKKPYVPDQLTETVRQVLDETNPERV